MYVSNLYVQLLMHTESHTRASHIAAHYVVTDHYRYSCTKLLLPAGVARVSFIHIGIYIYIGVYSL